MAIFIVTFAIMLMVVTAMSVGVMAKREPIKGSCGGLNKLEGIECACKGTCSGNFREVPRETTNNAYRA